MQYVLTDVAQKDLIEIADYIAIDNKKAAQNLMIQMKSSFETLAGMPEIGHHRPDLTSQKIRFWKVKSYLVVYQITTESIIILRVLSAYRDITVLLDDYSPV